MLSLFLAQRRWDVDFFTRLGQSCPLDVQFGDAVSCFQPIQLHLGHSARNPLVHLNGDVVFPLSDSRNGHGIAKIEFGGWVRTDISINSLCLTFLALGRLAPGRRCLRRVEGEFDFHHLLVLDDHVDLDGLADRPGRPVRGKDRHGNDRGRPQFTLARRDVAKFKRLAGRDDQIG